MNKKLGIGIVVVAIVVVLMFAGCVEEEKTEANPHQDLIDMIETKSDIKFSNWNVEKFNDGYIVTADSYSGGKPIWYIEKNNVYWVNGKSNTVSLVSEEAPEYIQDAILHPESVAKREAILKEFDIVELNEDLLYDYSEENCSKAEELELELEYSLHKAPKVGFGTTYSFGVCEGPINIKLLKEATHKDWKYRYYFVEIDGYQGWISSEVIEKYNSLRPFEQELEHNLELKKKIEAEELANKNSPYLELDNPNYNIIDKNEIYYWSYDDEDSTISCYDGGFGLYEKLPDSLLDRGEKFAETNPCGKTLKLNILKEATHKDESWVYWLVDYEGSVGWISKGWLEENNK